jgi:hypothetical protein
VNAETYAVPKQATHEQTILAVVDKYGTVDDDVFRATYSDGTEPFFWAVRDAFAKLVRDGVLVPVKIEENVSSGRYRRA